MKTEIIKKVQAPQPEPTTFGKCLITSRSPILVPSNASKESFDKYGFFKYQPLKQFEPDIDLYPIQKKAKSCNALFFQTSNKIDVFILQKGKLPNDSLVNSTIVQLLEASKVSKSKPVASYSRENFIFYEKTLSSKLLFIDKGTTQVKTINLGTNSYYHISLPIFVLSSPQYYQYKKESEKVYFLAGQDAFQFNLGQINNNGLFNSDELYSKLPHHIQKQIIAGTCICDTIAYPHYNSELTSDDLNAPRASFMLRSYSTVAEDPVNPFLIFEGQTGAFLMNKIGEIVGETKGEYYDVEYSFDGDVTVYKIVGKVRIYGYKPSISMERQAQSNVFVSTLPSSWQGVVFRLNENPIVLKEVYETLDTGGGNPGQPSGCPPA